MPTLSEKLHSDILSQVDNPTAEISDNCKVQVTCSCGASVCISTRALVRKWKDRGKYLCKGCHVKTYAGTTERIEKFKKSFAKTANNPIHRAKCSENARKSWLDPVVREKVTSNSRRYFEEHKEDVLTRLEKAREKFKNSPGFREHLAKIRASQNNKPSILESIVCGVLNDVNIGYVPQFPLGFYVYDICVPDRKLIIEVQGEYWHKNSVSKDSAKATYASANGYTVKHIWEHEFSAISKIYSLISGWLDSSRLELVDFNLNDLRFEIIPTYDARVFLGIHHYLPAISKSGFHVGAKLDNELIAVATFSHVTRNETAKRLGIKSSSVRELSRFCIHSNRHKLNAASYILSRFVKLFRKHNKHVTTLISFADQTQGHHGGIYSATNWIFDGETKPSYHYVGDGGFIAHKKTIWDRAKKLGMTELEYATENKYIRIDGLPKRRFILKIGK